MRSPPAKPGAGSLFLGRWTEPASGCQSNCRVFRCSIATEAIAAIAALAFAATSPASINCLRVRRERPIGFMPVPETAQALNGGAPVVEVRQRTAVPGQPATERPARPERPALTIAPAAANVLPFRQAPALEAKPPVLSAGERKAFRELAQELTARLRGMPDAPVAGESASDRALAEELLAPSQTPGALPSSPRTADPGVTEAPVNGDVDVGAEEGLAAPVVDTSLIDRIPIGVLVYRHDALIYANRHFLDWTGYDGVDALTAAGRRKLYRRSPDRLY